MQEIAKKLKWEEFVAKKLSNRDKPKGRIVNATTKESYDCESDDGSNSGFTEQSEFLVRCERILWSWIREQLWSDPRSSSNFYDSESQDLAALRFWVAAKYTEWYGFHGKRFWTTTCSRRTILHNFQQFKEFGIFISRYETWHFRDSKERDEKKESLNTPIQSPHFQSRVDFVDHTSGTYSHVGMMDYPRVPITEWNLGKFHDSMEFQSWKLNFKTEVCLRKAEPQVTMLWIKEGRTCYVAIGNRAT